jgi:RNA 2',3'-cyclic 3'-phosphodiesterase
VGVSLDVAAAVTRRQSAIAEDAPAGLFRFVDARQAHVTLKFLGQRSVDEQLRVIAVAAAVAKVSAPFTVAFGGIGVFPDARRPHTLWMGLTEGSSALIALAARLETALAEVGFAPEDRPFVPHLTLARIKQRPAPAMMKKLLGEAAEPTLMQTVESFALMESRAASAGVRYVPLRTFALEKTCTPSK